MVSFHLVDMKPPKCFNRFVPRHDDELELEVDDPLLVEVHGEDYWYEGYNMRTGARGIFPAYYAMEVTKDKESHIGMNFVSICSCTSQILLAAKHHLCSTVEVKTQNKKLDLFPAQLI